MIKFRRWRDDRRGSIAVETAVIAPVLFLITMGAVDLTRWVIAWQELKTSTLTIAQIASVRAVTGGTNPYNQLRSSSGYIAATAAYAQLPDLTSGSPPTFGVVISSVIMTPVNPPCQPQPNGLPQNGPNCFTAHVAWTGDFIGTLGATEHRPCDLTLGQQAVTADASDAVSPSRSTLPPDAFSPAPILVVDVYYTYNPLFTTTYAPLHSNVRMEWMEYFPSRTGPADSQSWFHYLDDLSSPRPNVDFCPIDPSWPP